MSLTPALDAAGEPPSWTGPVVSATDDRTVELTDVDQDALCRLLAGVLVAEGAPDGAEASLFLVDSDRIAELKAEHLGGDGSPTDVLSFPVDGVSAGAELIGDVVLCPSVASLQAPTHTGTVEDELALLVVHGGLHLAGWDHVSEDERAAMWERERQLLCELHGSPARDPWGESTT
ncbi:MAG: rRNA maturation RNase YbeY [Microthrixaceae bacterium]